MRSIAAAAVLMAGLLHGAQAAAQARSDSVGDVADWQERTKVARDWLDGRYADRWARTIAYDGPPVVLRFSAHNPADGSVVRDVFTPAFDVLRRMSNGKLIVEPRWGSGAKGLLGGWDALARDETDMTACYATLESKKRGFHLLTLLDLPNLFPNAAVATAVSERLYSTYFAQGFAKNGVRIARMKATGPFQIFTTAEVAGLADVAGLKLASADGIHARTVAALGATPVLLASPAVRGAITKGEIDGAEVTDAAAAVYGLNTATQYELVADIGRTNLPYCLAPAFLARLPSGLKPVFNAWLRAEAQAEAQIFYGRNGAVARDAFSARGGIVRPVDDAGLARLASHGREIERKAVEEMERQGLPARQFMRDVRRLTAIYARYGENDLMMQAIVYPLTDLMPADGAPAPGQSQTP